LKELRLGLSDATEEGLLHLKELPKLERLIVAAPCFENQTRHLAQLSKLQEVRVLSFDSSRIALQHLKTAPNLHVLDLSVSGLEKDADFEQVKDLKKLKKIDLPHAFSDKAFVCLAQLTDLEEVAFSSLSELKGHGLQHLKNLTKLTELNLSYTGVTDEGLQAIEGLTHLKKLSLPEHITDKGLAHIKPLVNLTHLHVQNSQITDAGIDHLKELVNLQVLDLSRAKLSEAGVLQFKSLHNLREINLFNTPHWEAKYELRKFIPGLKFH
jgi:Leucine-rich repeat (LRR) protein